MTLTWWVGLGRPMGLQCYAVFIVYVGIQNVITGTVFFSFDTQILKFKQAELLTTNISNGDFS